MQIRFQMNICQNILTLLLYFYFFYLLHYFLYKYNYGSTQTYFKLKIQNHQTPKYSKVSGNEKKTNITKYF